MKNSQKELKLDVVFSPSFEGGFTATVPALPGCISEGENLEEAKKNILEAIELYLDDITEQSDIRLIEEYTPALIQQLTVPFSTVKLEDSGE